MKISFVAFEGHFGSILEHFGLHLGTLGGTFSIKKRIEKVVPKRRKQVRRSSLPKSIWTVAVEGVHPTR